MRRNEKLKYYLPKTRMNNKYTYYPTQHPLKSVEGRVKYVLGSSRIKEF